MSKKSKIIIYSLVISLLELLVLSISLISLNYSGKTVEPLDVIENNVFYSWSTDTFTILSAQSYYYNNNTTGYTDVGESIEIPVPNDMQILVKAGQVVTANTNLARNKDNGNTIVADETCKIESITQTEDGTIISMFATANQKIHFVLPVHELKATLRNDYSITVTLGGKAIKFGSHEYTYSTIHDGYLFTLKDIESPLLRDGSVIVNFVYDIPANNNIYALRKKCVFKFIDNYVVIRIKQYNDTVKADEYVNVQLETVGEDAIYYYIVTDDYMLITADIMMF
ncbi:MAG: hypothetical protein LBE09_03515 [Christensenellaceae bacterium]|jgi:hypothetical protein|nr:hypothetical protein [Christensenellaceae bacterium]